MFNMKFPDGFRWGVATAAYQNEGAVTADGRGESIWDRFCRIPGNIANADNGDIACDSYYRYKEDVAIIKELGIKSYRFSIAWPRIFPSGYGEVNQKGIDYYSNVIDELLANDIEPFVTLYHWDLPQALQDEGGWANKTVADRFAAYAETMFAALGGRVKHWITINEPWVAAFNGYGDGMMAPGIRDFSSAVAAAHNMLRAHGKAVRIFREMKLEGEIGIALNLCPREPATGSDEDIAAAKRNDGYVNRWFLDAIFRGSYPQDMLEHYRSRGVVIPEPSAEDMELIREPVDFIGVNYYTVEFTKHDPANWPVEIRLAHTDLPCTNYGWPVVERGLAELLTRLKDEYDAPCIYVTENGASFLDVISVKGEILDEARIDYLERHIMACHAAIEANVQLKGYFVWTLIDDFEWNTGFSNRFGLVHLDRATCDRTIKKSGRWYTNVINNNGIFSLPQE